MGLSSVNFKLSKRDQVQLKDGKSLVPLGVGVKTVTLDDQGVVELWDLPSNLIFSENNIAIKRLKVWNNKAEVEFFVEVEILHSAECFLDRARRMNIKIDFIEGIAYLHHHSTPHIIHRDIKASNVLLDSKFQPFIVDFGFAKFIHDELASGKKPFEKLSPTVKRSIVEWALPLVCEGKFNEVVNPRPNGKYVGEELLNYFCHMELTSYEQIFEGLELVFKKIKKQLEGILDNLKEKPDVVTLLMSLQKTLEFEDELAEKFGGGTQSREIGNEIEEIGMQNNSQTTSDIRKKYEKKLDSNIKMFEPKPKHQKEWI
ncbi:hypothetical protein CRYUN_Cryun02cG0113800 [Craigia yunnanensis]